MNKISKYSWTIYPEKNLFIKKMDKSTFLHHGTGIPKEFKSYFDIENLKIGEKKEIQIKYFGEVMSAHFEIINLDRARLMWGKELREIICSRFPETYDYFKDGHIEEITFPELKLKKLHKGQIYELSFIDEEKIFLDIQSEIEESNDSLVNLEGNLVSYYGKRYERNHDNRKRAIEIHGLECKICGFNFEKVYGEIGRGYIEIHHINPLYMKKEEHEVNPETDLIPVCSNCHKMLHRDKNKILSIQELKNNFLK